jgi:hypothetical protein
MIARSMSRADAPVTFAVIGGCTKDLAQKEQTDQPLYVGNSSYKVTSNCFGVIKRK